MPDSPNPPLDLLPGSADILVLQALAWGPAHGYAVAGRIRDRTDGVLALEDAPLYKSLHRLERQGHVVAEWGLSENNRRARYYDLTPTGRGRLRTEAATWRQYAEALFKVLDPAAT
ncbi:MAG: PadR family transcriptional regulator [Gemmatirosa sp.]|nr:PadR family transcriptional regulator [Gemmatirosa sp.]